METNVLFHEQLVMAETCKNELKVSHNLPMVTSSKDVEFNLVKVNEDEIKKGLPTYDKNGFNCDISSIVQTNFEMVPIQFGVIAPELNENYALKSSLQGFNFGIFNKCNEAVFLFGDVFNIELRTSLFFQP